MATMLRARTRQAYAERVAALRALDSVFNELACCLKLPPRCGRAMLRSLPRHDLVELRRAMEQLPALQELVRSLGRLEESEAPNAPTSLERVGRAVERMVEVDRQRSGDRGSEVRGIERSGDLARMLPAEAALLARRTLRTLWLARWAERTLLTYHAPGVLTQRVSEQQTFEDGIAESHVRAERGPIVVILDTSGSMHGNPERIAKAAVLQLMAVAHMEDRPFYIYNFSGSGDLAEQELSFDGDGLMRMLRFVGSSFHGGTEPDEALRRACARLTSDDWRQADLVVVSDGEFVTGPEVLSLMKRIRHNSEARFHGVLTGTGNGLDSLQCDTTHDVADWLTPR